MTNKKFEDDDYDGERCTICGKLFKWVGMSNIEGVCLHCMMEDKE